MTLHGDSWQDRFGLSQASAQALVETVASLPDPEVMGETLAEALNRMGLTQREAETHGDDFSSNHPGAALDDPDAARALARVAYGAPFLLRYASGRPQTLNMGALDRLSHDGALIPWRRYAGPAETPLLEEGDLMSRLRRWKYDNLLRLTARDLMGFQDTAATCRAISDLADTMIRIAYAHAFGQGVAKHGLPLRDDGGLAGGGVVGMGKLGGRELNFASDVDLIFIQEGDNSLCRMMGEITPPPIDPDSHPIPSDQDGDALWGEEIWNAWRACAEGVGEAPEGSLTSGEFHNRLARQVTRLLSAQQAEGFGFRVDNDLRPGGSAGFLSPNLAFMEAYYIQHGREWERTAMLKARVVTGCPQVRTQFSEMIRPFVYRRYLDFGALEGIAIVKHDIDRSNRAALESDLKLGRGGIRENEFLVQALQLLYGGKRPELRQTSHVSAVKALREAQILEPEEAESILSDYWLLRTLENRIQMVGEIQTHALPNDPLERLRITHDFESDPAHGETSGMETVLARLEAARSRNESRFRKLFGGLGGEGFPDAQAWRDAVGGHLPEGSDREAVLTRMDTLFEGLMKSRSGERCVFKLVKLLKRKEVYRVGTESALPRWLDFFEQIGNRNALYALIETHPPIVPWIADILTEGGRHAEVLIRHPEFLETFFALGETWESLAAQFDNILEQAADEEDFILELQGAKSRCMLKALTVMLNDSLDGPLDGPLDGAPHDITKDPDAASRPESHRILLSDLADAVVSVSARFAWRQVGERLGYPPGGDEETLAGFAVLAMGKLGSRDMRLGSDLDLVFVCGKDGVTSKGQNAYQVYTKVAQKLSTLLTVPTQFGRLYELDHRLRPFGNKGVLVPGLAAYRNFLIPEGGGGAEIWNFQAFSRARSVAGDAALGEALIDLVGEAWRKRGDEPARVARAVREMLDRLVDQHGVPDGEPAVALKFGVGGMIGFEFLHQAYFLLDQQRAGAGWTSSTTHETLKRLAPDYAQLGRLDERLSCHESDGRHIFQAQHADRLAAIGQRWRFGEVEALCKRMEKEITRAFLELGA